MGVKRRYDGLEISPCFPAEWNRAEMTRHFRNADYHIIIENPQHIESGKPIVSVDGVQIEGNRLPDFADGSRHEVKVVLRKKRLQIGQIYNIIIKIKINTIYFLINYR